MAHKQVVEFCTASPLNGLAVQPTPARGPGRIRTCDARFRKPTLYPLSYGADVLSGWQAWRESSPTAASSLPDYRQMGCRGARIHRGDHERRRIRPDRAADLDGETAEGEVAASTTVVTSSCGRSSQCSLLRLLRESLKGVTGRTPRMTSRGCGASRIGTWRPRTQLKHCKSEPKSIDSCILGARASNSSRGRHESRSGFHDSAADSIPDR